MILEILNGIAKEFGLRPKSNGEPVKIFLFQLSKRTRFVFQKFSGSEEEAKPDVEAEVGPALRCWEREKQQNWVNCGMWGSEGSLHTLQRSLYTAGSSEM